MKLGRRVHMPYAVLPVLPVLGYLATASASATVVLPGSRVSVTGLRVDDGTVWELKELEKLTSSDF